MTDQIPADKVREIIARHRDGASHRGGMILNDLTALLPLPTLADMTAEERAACQWMQADVTSRSGHYVVATPHDDGDDAAVLINPDGEVDWVALEYVTPRPDLPRLEWSGNQKPAPAPAPPNTLTEGSEWDNVDALARACEESGRDQIVVADKDGDVFVWGVDAEWWETGLPGCDYAPHTIIHAGKKADQ